jgi:hypothetical protein
MQQVTMCKLSDEDSPENASIASINGSCVGQSEDPLCDFIIFFSFSLFFSFFLVYHYFIIMNF